MIQDLYNHLHSPGSNDAMARELADTKAQLEKLRGQVEVLSTPERPKTMATGGSTVRAREKVGRWQEYLETPISVSQRRSRRETPRQSRILDEDELPQRMEKMPTSPIVLPPHQPSPAKALNAEIDSDDEVARLKDALARAEGQIAQLKTEKAAGRGPGEGHEMHSRPLGPAMMPGTHFQE